MHLIAPTGLKPKSRKVNHWCCWLSCCSQCARSTWVWGMNRRKIKRKWYTQYTHREGGKATGRQRDQGIVRFGGRQRQTAAGRQSQGGVEGRETQIERGGFTCENGLSNKNLGTGIWIFYVLATNLLSQTLCWNCFVTHLLQAYILNNMQNNSLAEVNCIIDCRSHPGTYIILKQSNCIPSSISYEYIYVHVNIVFLYLFLQHIHWCRKDYTYSQPFPCKPKLNIIKMIQTIAWLQNNESFLER